MARAMVGVCLLAVCACAPSYYVNSMATVKDKLIVSAIESEKRQVLFACDYDGSDKLHCKRLPVDVARLDEER